ncbi:hypothetical protein GRAN_0913 [Granulicella sibirica]|uniref:Uncharacterized protein n=1 Tax=Granulicella sibirica TaxID=2479048 RepID=A0A4Q0T1Y8_9BACT|nr:hypothetical protein GRAN_0913 [Granulicella sibirica]
MRIATIRVTNDMERFSSEKQTGLQDVLVKERSATGSSY